MRFARPLLAALAAAAALGCGSSAPESPAQPPNVILVITDDQGYGDLGAHGNSMLRTPNLDRLHGESVRFTNFHVDPTCAPTRAALMTGRYSSRTGVWHTIMGRSIVARDETLLPQLLAEGGYATGMFGKWHLGDNYPFRPEDRGFQRVVRHGGGGVGQTPDFWGNDYFDDTYWADGVPTKYQGYCTDVWFDEALKFIEANRERRFFAYISTNAPHAPFLVDEKYSKPYAERGAPAPMDKFYGMIENIDENMGRLDAKLAELGLRDNTLLIFMTDNGTAAGVAGRDAKGSWKGFNAGMRGQKGSEYDGGHRVPFFVRWPAGGLGEPRDIPALTAHIDVLPTLAELAGVEVPARLDVDGRSLTPLLRGEGGWAERTLFVHSQRVDLPERWRKAAVMTERWRLVNERELYDMAADPGQQRNVAAANPEVVEGLRAAYDDWWRRIGARFNDQVRIPIGERENPARITAHDWLPDDGADQSVPWNHDMVRRDPAVNGSWAIEVAEAGTYEFELLQWDRGAGKKLDAVEAWVKVGAAEAKSAVPPGAESVTVRLELPAGPARLQTGLRPAKGKERGAFFVYAKKL